MANNAAKKKRTLKQWNVTLLVTDHPKFAKGEIFFNKREIKQELLKAFDFSAGIRMNKIRIEEVKHGANTGN